jgi:hypothetical protein
MNSPKKNPASANWTGSSKATQPENHMNEASGGFILPRNGIYSTHRLAAILM